MPAVLKSVHASRVEERACVLKNVHASRVDSLLKFNFKSRITFSQIQVNTRMLTRIYQSRLSPLSVEDHRPSSDCKRVHADVLEIRTNLSESVFEALFNDS
jgi:hypothetical protein